MFLLSAVGLYPILSTPTKAVLYKHWPLKGIQCLPLMKKDMLVVLGVGGAIITFTVRHDAPSAELFFIDSAEQPEV